jgi:SH3 domain-containing YSC84-like protein 1
MRWSTLAFTLALGSLPLLAQEPKVDERLDDAAGLISEIMGTPDKSIPQDLINKAYCVVVVPGVKKAAFVVGAKYGRGFAVCRASNGWGPPAAVRIEGGSVGFQIGVSSTDYVLLVMNEQGMRHLESSKFTLGGEATVAAGPVGRDTSAQTDAAMSAEMLAWSRSKGAFAGISLDGATLRADNEENQALYGQKLETSQILNGSMKTPAAAEKLIEELNRYSNRRTG